MNITVLSRGRGPLRLPLMLGASPAHEPHLHWTLILTHSGTTATVLASLLAFSCPQSCTVAVRLFVRHHTDLPICSTGKAGCATVAACHAHAHDMQSVVTASQVSCRLAWQAPLTAKQHVSPDIQVRNDGVAFLMHVISVDSPQVQCCCRTSTFNVGQNPKMLSLRCVIFIQGIGTAVV